MKRNKGSVPVSVVAKIYGKDACWVRAGIITGYLPIGTATRDGKKVESLNEIRPNHRINYYISPKLLYEQTGYKWEGDDKVQTSYRLEELKNFALQYNEWKTLVRRIDSGQRFRPDPMIFAKSGGETPDPTANAAVAKAFYEQRMQMIERCCNKASRDWSTFIFRSVTEDLSYADLLERSGMLPFNADDFYLMRRRFFKELDGERQ